MKGRTHALLGASLFFAPGVFGVSGSASGWSPGQTFGVCVAGAMLLAIATVITVRTTCRLMASLRMKHSSGRVDGPASPVKPDDPGWLSQHIVERAEQIRRALSEEPSEVEVEMCILGYRACEDDMITLGLLVEERLPKASPLRRRKLRAARWSALEALIRTREAFPPGVLRARHREHS